MLARASLGLLLFLFSFAGCGSDAAEERAAKVDAIGGEAGAAMRAFLDKDPSMKKFFDDAYGFAIWPSIGEGGFVVGGGGGRGFVYEQGKLIGESKLSFVSVGAQIGGQTFAEVVFFRDKAALDAFKGGNFEFGAKVSAIAAESGVANKADYAAGVAVFTLPLKGLMAAASVSGQDFTFEPK